MPVIFLLHSLYFPGINKNKRPMGHIAHLRKQFKSFKTYDYIIKLIKKTIKKLYEN